MTSTARSHGRRAQDRALPSRCVPVTTKVSLELLALALQNERWQLHCRQTHSR